MTKWRYDFDCWNCDNEEVVAGALYCKPTRAGHNPIHADDDYVVRCGEYMPKQMTLWEGEGQCSASF